MSIIITMNSMKTLSDTQALNVCPSPSSKPFRLCSQSQAGLTLLEVLFALIIVSIATTVFLTTSKTSQVGNSRSQVFGRVATAITEASEAVKLMPAEEVRLLLGTELSHSQGKGISVTATARSILPNDVSGYGELKQEQLRHVTFKAYFLNQEGGSVVKSFTTIVYNPE